MKLYIIRHGQTEWNVEKRLQGWKNSPLTQKGRSDAERLAERLKDINFDYIYSSTQERAFKTAEIIKKDRNIDIIKLETLKEIGFGKWQGMKIKDIEVEYKNNYNTYMDTPHLYQPIEGSESFQDIFERAKKALDRIIENGGENVLIVSHGVTIRVLIAIIKEISLDDLHSIPIHIGTALNICQIDGEKMKFIVEGDTGHME